MKKMTIKKIALIMIEVKKMENRDENLLGALKLGRKAVPGTVSLPRGVGTAEPKSFSGMNNTSRQLRM